MPPVETVSANLSGIQAAPDVTHIKSSETYIGYDRAENFSSPTGIIHDQSKTYDEPHKLDLNHWGLAGTWLVDEEKAILNSDHGEIVFRFFARDLHLVLAPGTNGKPIHFRVLLDGQAPGLNHGMDTDADGNGVIKEQRLYQLVRQSKDISEHTFSIEFLDSGVQAFAFTFG